MVTLLAPGRVVAVGRAAAVPVSPGSPVGANLDSIPLNILTFNKTITCILVLAINISYFVNINGHLSGTKSRHYWTQSQEQRVLCHPCFSDSPRFSVLVKTSSLWMLFESPRQFIFAIRICGSAPLGVLFHFGTRQLLKRWRTSHAMRRLLRLWPNRSDVSCGKLSPRQLSRESRRCRPCFQT